MSNEVVRYCLITGCAGGIGQSLVRGFSSAGYQVIGTDIVVKPDGLDCPYYIQFDVSLIGDDEQYAARVLYYSDWATFGLTYYKGYNFLSPESNKIISPDQVDDINISDNQDSFLKNEMFGIVSNILRQILIFQACADLV